MSKTLKRDSWKALSATIVSPIGGRPPSYPDNVRIAREPGKSLFAGRIEIQGVPKFYFLENSAFEGFPPARRTVCPMRQQAFKYWLFTTFPGAAPGDIACRLT
jgi:hypothetical protein